MDPKCDFIGNCLKIKQLHPIVHNITNFVAMNFSANALAAVGASPLMSAEKEEMEEIVSSADALVVNIGTIDSHQAEAMEIAVHSACRLGKPWVLDPAGVGLSRLRTRTAMHLVSDFHPTIIRANASEILCLSGCTAKRHGLDSAVSCSEALEEAKEMSRSCSSVVVLSGEIDYITDGQTVVQIHGGSPIMKQVTAMGCTASALCAAFAAVCSDALEAASCAMAAMAAAGKHAAAKCGGPGTFAACFLDCLAGIDPSECSKTIRYE